MKLDRNTNRAGRGKYALVNMRLMIPLLEAFETNGTHMESEQVELVTMFDRLVEKGIITLGNETPGDQFFVMKYKDKFTAAGLYGYAGAVWEHYRDLMNDIKMTARIEKQMCGSELTPEERDEAKQHHEKLKSITEYHSQILGEARSADKLGNRIPD